MLFLLLAIFSSAMISILMRLSTDKVSANLSMLAINYLICAVCGVAYACTGPSASDSAGLSLTVTLGILNGVLFLASFLLLQINTQKNGIVLSSVFMKLGLLVPFVLSVLFFHELPTLSQAAGFLLAVSAILLINLKPGSTSSGFGFGLVLLLLLGGCADAMAKVFDVLGPPALENLFLFLSFSVAFLLCLGLVARKREHPGLREILFGTLIGIPNFFSSKFLLGALAQLPAVVVYPTFCVATMLIVTLTGVAVFRERLTKRQWAAMAVIIAALVLLNR